MKSCLTCTASRVEIDLLATAMIVCNKTGQCFQFDDHEKVAGECEKYVYEPGTMDEILS